MSQGQGKRPAADSFGSAQLVKRAKAEAEAGPGSTQVAVVNGNVQHGALIQAVQRTSSLQAPVMELTGTEPLVSRFVYAIGILTSLQAILARCLRPASTPPALSSPLAPWTDLSVR